MEINVICDDNFNIYGISYILFLNYIDVIYFLNYEEVM